MEADRPTTRPRRKPSRPAAPSDPAAEQRRLLIEADRQRRAAEFEARRRDWAEAAPGWQAAWRADAERDARRRAEREAFERADRDAAEADREAQLAEERLRREAAERFRRAILAELNGTGPTAFSVLGLRATATAAEVKAAHRALALRHHPDRGGDATEFVRIQRAYEAALAIVEGRDVA